MATTAKRLPLVSLVWTASLLSNSIAREAAFLVTAPFRRAIWRKSGSPFRVHSSADPTEGSTIIGDGLPFDIPRRDDVLVALEAVRKACQVTERLQPLQGDDDAAVAVVGSVGTISKPDLSPVTVADFAVQGLILQSLREVFPLDGFIAEEDSSSLRDDKHLCAQVATAAALDPATLIEAIDLGKSYQRWNHQDCKRPSRVWVLDPIDGTRGFLRGKLAGGQYAIALALIEDDGGPVIGVLGCPNLPTQVDDENFAWTRPNGSVEPSERDQRGCIFVASRGGGCYQLPLTCDEINKIPPRRLRATQESVRSVKDARFCIGVERYSDALGQCAGMAEDIHGIDRALNADGEIIRARRMDSQAKHGVIARGGAELYVRLPKAGYVEWIWDHAAGNVVIEEAGGEMSDVRGQPIDFSLGAQLSPDVRGVLMSSGGAFHKALVGAYATVDAARSPS